MSRRILLVAHPRRPEAIAVAKGVVERLTCLGIDELAGLASRPREPSRHELGVEAT